MSFTNSHSVLVEYYNMLGSELERKVGGHRADEIFDIAGEKASMLLNQLGMSEASDDLDSHATDDLQTLLQLAVVRSHLLAEVFDWIEANPEMIENLLLDRETPVPCGNPGPDCAIHNGECD